MEKHKKPRRRLPVKLVAWGNYSAAKKAFADKALELRSLGQGADPGLKNGMLLFDISIEWFFDLLKEKQKRGKTITSNQLKKMVSLPQEPPLLCSREFDHLFPSVTAFFEICYKHGLSCRLCEYQPPAFNPRSKVREAYVKKHCPFFIHYAFLGESIDVQYYSKIHVALIPLEIKKALVPGDKIEIDISYENGKNWRITRIL